MWIMWNDLLPYVTTVIWLGGNPSNIIICRLLNELFNPQNSINAKEIFNNQLRCFCISEINNTNRLTKKNVCNLFLHGKRFENT